MMVQEGKPSQNDSPIIPSVTFIIRQIANRLTVEIPTITRLAHPARGCQTDSVWSQPAEHSRHQSYHDIARRAGREDRASIIEQARRTIVEIDTTCDSLEEQHSLSIDHSVEN